MIDDLIWKLLESSVPITDLSKKANVNYDSIMSYMKSPHTSTLDDDAKRRILSAIQELT